MYTNKRNGLRIDHWGIPPVEIPASKKTSSLDSKNFQFDKMDSNQLISDVFKPRGYLLKEDFVV